MNLPIKTLAAVAACTVFATGAFAQRSSVAERYNSFTRAVSV
jgi:hypothetical protein